MLNYALGEDDAKLCLHKLPTARCQAADTRQQAEALVWRILRSACKGFPRLHIFLSFGHFRAGQFSSSHFLDPSSPGSVSSFSSVLKALCEAWLREIRTLWRTAQDTLVPGPGHYGARHSQRVSGAVFQKKSLTLRHSILYSITFALELV